MATTGILGKALQYWRYRTVFKSHSDVQAYRQVRDHPERCGGPVLLGIRGIDRPLLCRPRTMDPITLWDAFYLRYHLPEPWMRVASVILDLGANAGYTSASLAARYPRARIVAVEMDAANAEVCSSNLAQFGSRCAVIGAAIWSAAGTVNYGGSNVHDLAIGGGTAPRTARAMTIDEVLDSHGVGEADYVKMDIEGAEASVLVPPISWAPRVRNLSLEIHPPASYEWCRDALTAAGFHCTPHPRHHAGLLATRR